MCWQVRSQGIEVCFPGLFSPSKGISMLFYLGKYFVSNDVVFVETSQFFFAPPISTSQEDEDEWLVYHVTHASTENNDVVPLSPSSSIEQQWTITPLEPPLTMSSSLTIVQFYSRKKEVNNTCPKYNLYNCGKYKETQGNVNKKL